MNQRHLFLAIVMLGLIIFGGLLLWQNVNPQKASLLPAPLPVSVPLSVKSYNFSQIEPLPFASSLPNEKVSLGKQLFNEVLLSRDNSLSCASCHDLAKGGTDRLSVSIGINALKGTRNAPTVFNSAFNFAQFWDGREATIEDQVAGPIHNPIEMDSNWQDVVTKLKAKPAYVYAFKEVYSAPINKANIIDAIAHYERSLITPDSSFDRYLRGEPNSLTQEELKGYQLFKGLGCISCHQGINVGGNMFQRIGAVSDYFKGKEIKPSDLGRFNITGQENDRFVFKVPSLRNVAVTAPYFHDGSIKTLEEAVSVMGEYQLGRQLSDDEIRLLSLFLHTLTGQWQGQTLQ